MDNQLKPISFTGGIRSEDINYNFGIVKDMMDRERLRVGGYGIVEGFSIEVLSSSQIKVNQGMLINKDGEEVVVSQKILNISPPEYVEIKLIDSASAITVSSDGQILLPHIPYSSNKPGHFDTAYYQNNTPNTELIIRDAINPSVNIVPISINNNIITVQQNTWAGKKVFVEYKYAQNRLDTILVNKDGEYIIEESVQSTSPSHVDLNREDEYFIIGFILTNIGEDISLEKYEMYRTSRKIYVDQNNELYLNGRKYLGEQLISFSEITNPRIGDMWYDKESNNLLVYEDKDGIVGWIPIGEDSSYYARESRIFSPNENPEDMRTFTFGQQPNLRFVPGKNQLEVIIDNTPIMSDQFTEVIDTEETEYTNSGIGFRLNNELDKKSHVEVRVLHSVWSKVLRKTFQRTANFVDEGNMMYDTSNTQQIFETKDEYVIGENQLEVFYNGKKLIKNQDKGFYEILNEAEEHNEDHKGLSSKHFKINKDLEENDIIQYKISKTVYSYDSLNELIEDIRISAEESAGNAATDISSMQLDIHDFGEQINDLSQRTEDMENQQEEFIRKEEGIEVTSLPESVRNNIVSGQFNQIFETKESIITIDELRVDDIIFIFHYNASNINNGILFKGTDYNIVEKPGGIIIGLEGHILNPNNTIHVIGIKLGIRY